ncbi:MAG: hypothetical protein GY926_16050, partial [bacterium]|nr:hypothetical protein [bacterium]
LSRAELLHQGRARGAYSEPGWIHRGLGDLITDHGVPAEARAVSDLTELADALSDGPVIASVSFRFPTIGSKGGHLVLVTGPTWTNGELSGFFFNDPSRWEPTTPTSQQPDSTPASPVGSSPQQPDYLGSTRYLDKMSRFVSPSVAGLSATRGVVTEAAARDQLAENSLVSKYLRNKKPG